MGKELDSKSRLEHSEAAAANGYARKAFQNPNWLRRCTPEQAQDAAQMIDHHADAELRKAALPSIQRYLPEKKAESLG
jgi:hypothetical protein